MLINYCCSDKRSHTCKFCSCTVINLANVNKYGFFYRQRISGQRSEPNKTVSEFHLSAVKGILLPHPMLSSPEIIPSISPLPDTTDKNVSSR